MPTNLAYKLTIHALIRPSGTFSRREKEQQAPYPSVRAPCFASAKLPRYSVRSPLMNPNYLDFEQPIADLEAKLQDLRSAWPVDPGGTWTALTVRVTVRPWRRSR